MSRVTHRLCFRTANTNLDWTYTTHFNFTIQYRIAFARNDKLDSWKVSPPSREFKTDDLTKFYFQSVSQDLKKSKYVRYKIAIHVIGSTVPFAFSIYTHILISIIALEHMSRVIRWGTVNLGLSLWGSLTDVIRIET